MLSLVISKTKNAIAIMEPDGMIVAVNAAFVQMTGYSAADAVGKRYDDCCLAQYGCRVRGRISAGQSGRT